MQAREETDSCVKGGQNAGKRRDRFLCEGWAECRQEKSTVHKVDKAGMGGGQCQQHLVICSFRKMGISMAVDGLRTAGQH